MTPEQWILLGIQFGSYAVLVLVIALIAAEAELQERDKPVRVSFTDGALSSFCPFPCGVPLYPKWKHCPNCGRRLDWK